MQMSPSNIIDGGLFCMLTFWPSREWTYQSRLRSAPAVIRNILLSPFHSKNDGENRWKTNLSFDQSVNFTCYSNFHFPWSNYNDLFLYDFYGNRWYKMWFPGFTTSCKFVNELHWFCFLLSCQNWINPQLTRYYFFFFVKDTSCVNIINLGE